MTNVAHILASFSIGFRHRHELLRILTATPKKSSILTLDPLALKAGGIEVLVLDFDGVLAPHGFPAPLPEAEQWLALNTAVFGAENIFILSNKPTNARKSWFDKHFTGIRFISGERKKPFPDGLNKIGELAKVPLSAILMVDDRLLTGCLAAINAGARTFYVRRPFTSLSRNPVADLFFQIIRIMERGIVRLVT